jgi:hypothetical protein
MKLINTTGARWNPARGGHGLRLTAEGTFSLPTGHGAALDSLTEVTMDSGSGGAGGALFADVFSGRFWVSAAGRFTQFFARDVARYAWTPGNPFAALGDTVTVSRKPGARLEIGFTPRYRLTSEISLGGRYAMYHQAATTLSDAPAEGYAFAGVESLEARTAHLAGLGGSYSTLAAYGAGKAKVPYEFSLLWERAVSGSGGAPAASQLTMSARIFLQAWGAAKRPPRPADSTAAKPVAPLDTRPQTVTDTTRRPAPIPQPADTARRQGTPGRVIPKTAPPPATGAPTPPPSGGTTTPPPATDDRAKPEGT